MEELIPELAPDDSDSGTKKGSISFSHNKAKDTKPAVDLSFLFNSMIQNWLVLNGQGYSGDTIAWLGFLAHAPINKV